MMDTTLPFVVYPEIETVANIRVLVGLSVWQECQETERAICLCTQYFPEWWSTNDKLDELDRMQAYYDEFNS